MATVRKRPSGGYQIQVYLGVHPGTGKRSVTARTVHGTRREAEKIATAMQADADAKRIRPHDELTVTDLFDRWITLEGADWSPATIASTRNVQAHHLGQLATLRLDRLRRVDVAAHLAAMRDAGVGSATRAKAHARLRAALSWAVRLDLIATNPAKDVRAPKVDKSRAQAATASHVAAVLHLLDQDPEMAAFVRIAANTGARRGEVCALHWADLDHGAITWVRSVVDGGPAHGLVVKALKTERPKRTALGASTLAALQRWQIAVNADDFAHDHPTPWVFPGIKDRSQPVRPDLITKRWRRLCAAAGVPPTLRIHDMRHGAATDLLEAGFSAARVAGRLGHSRPSTTSDLYGHHVPADDQALADALDRALDQAMERDG